MSYTTETWFLGIFHERFFTLLRERGKENLKKPWQQIIPTYLKILVLILATNA